MIDTKAVRREAVKLYTAHHGNRLRAKQFADEVESRSSIYEEAQQVFKPRPKVRRQYRNDLDSLEATTRKLQTLLARTDIECNFPMRDGSTIRYPQILDSLVKQIKATRTSLTASSRTGSRRNDIAMLVSQVGTAFNLFEVPHEGIIQIIKLIVTDADDKTLKSYIRKALGK